MRRLALSRVVPWFRVSSKPSCLFEPRDCWCDIEGERSMGLAGHMCRG